MKTHEKTIMILGAGTMQIPALRTAKKKGWRVIAVDGNSEAPGRALADIFEPIDLKDTEGLLAQARLYKEKTGLDGVFTAGTDFSVSVAYIAENLGLPGIPVEIARNATDKDRMREIFTRHNVPGPRFLSCAAGGLDRLAEYAGSFPVVVKPVDNMGARGVQMVSEPALLKAACEYALKFSRCGRVIVEEFITGTEFSVDALIYRGRIHACGIADRHIYFPPFFVELGHTFPSAADKKVLDDIEDIFRRGIEALGITNGAAKGDIFHTGSGAVVGEIAARLSGGYMSGWTCPYAFGVDITEAAMNIAMGLPPGDLTPRRSWTSAERAFISIPGRAASIHGLDKALDVPGVQDIFTRIEEGSALTFPENNVEKCGNVITALPERKGAAAAVEKAVSWIFVRLEAGSPETEAFLFGPRGWQPPAFELPALLQARTCNMPAFFSSPRCLRILPIAGFSVADCYPESPGLEEAKDLKDWNCRFFGDAPETLTRLREKNTAPPWAREIVLGGVFWRALIRGGVQGALWVFDTLEREKTAENVCKRLEEWARE